MKYLIIIILFINCTLFPSQQSQASKNREQLGHLFLLSCIILPPTKTEEVTAVDKMDGTIEIQQNTFRSCGFGGKSLESSKIGYLKKCIQGQVYRPAQNDCKGTGTVADYYGAQKFQWCPTNDMTCNYLNTSEYPWDKISPAQTSCINEKIKNRYWSLYLTPDKRELTLHISRADEIPQNGNDFFWLGTSYSFGSSDAIALNKPDNIIQKQKSDFAYVLCQ